MYFSQHIVIDDIVPNYIFFLFQERTNYLSITTLMFSNSQIPLPELYAYFFNGPFYQINNKFAIIIDIH